MVTKGELKCSYLKYSPEITEEIFDAIIKKLKSFNLKGNGINSYEYFKKENSYLYIGIESFHINEGKTESTITVEDILGSDYDIDKTTKRESFKLPKRWKVKYTKETQKILDSWKKSNNADMSYNDLNEWCVSEPLYDNSYMYYADTNRYTEISIEQFKQYVLNEPIETDKKLWEIGTYVVSLKKESVGIPNFNKGRIAEIVSKNTIEVDSNYYACSKYQNDRNNVKWFATLKEAERFSKSIEITEDNLVENEYYNYSLYDGIIFKQGYKGYINIKHNVWMGSRENNWSFTNPIQKANSIEIKWYKTCLKQNKFIQKDELINYDDEGNLIEKELSELDIRDTKIWIGHNPSLIEKVKLKLYDLGCQKINVISEDIESLYIHSDLTLGYMPHGNLEYFKEHRNSEIKLKDIGINDNEATKSSLMAGEYIINTNYPCKPDPIVEDRVKLKKFDVKLI